jgi:integrase
MSDPLWRGIRRHGAGWQASVYVTGHPRSYQLFPLETSPETMQTWRRDEKGRMRLTAPARITKGTLAADARRYLQIVQDMPSFKSRKRDIGLWVEVYGHKSRDAITRGDVRIMRDEWHLRGPKRVWKRHQDRHGGAWVDVPGPLAASTVNHRLRALANLYTELGGRHAPNPAREVPELDEGDGEEYGLPYELIEAILAAMPDRGQGLRGKTRTDISLTKIRARVIAYTGLSPAEIGRLTPERVDLEAGWVATGRRRKGKGAWTGQRPLTPQGLDALKTFAYAGAWGKFSTSSMRQSIKRACATVAAAVEGKPGGTVIAAMLHKFRPYDLRHSYVSEVLEKSGDLHATQLLSGHKVLRTTLRYGKRGVNPALQAALDKVKAAGGFQGLSLVPENCASQ